MSIMISLKDSFRQAVEAASGGRNTVLYDRFGNPSIMVIIPSYYVPSVCAELEYEDYHPAFRVNGRDKKEIFIGKYLSCFHGGHLLSLPNQIPHSGVQHNDARALCSAKGPGWHMMTNVEWSAVSLWCLANGFLPVGNTDGDGASTLKPWKMWRTVPDTLKTLTGGPDEWFHDNSVHGISDMAGNLVNMVSGVRLNGGEVNIIEDNNAADAACDHSVGSPAWKAIKEDGSLVAPGSAGTLKLDANGKFATTISSGSHDNLVPFESFGPDEGVTLPPLMTVLGLAPTGIFSPETHQCLYTNIAANSPCLRGACNSIWTKGFLSFNFGLHQPPSDWGIRLVYID